MKPLYKALILSSLLISPQAKSAVRLFNLFQSNMVLQRDKPCNIWGWANSNETVTLQFGKQSFRTQADAQHTWKITLPPQPAGGPYTITVTGSNTITLNNVLFGDVWICGGQSNMQMRVSRTGYEADSLKDSNPNIRMFTVAVATDFVPLDTLRGGEWQVANRETVKEFSATAYFFGKHLQDSLHVPIGLISANQGSTLIETWMSAEAIHRFPQFDTYYDAKLAPHNSMAEIEKAFQKIKPEWNKRYYLKDDPGLEQKWYLPQTDVSDWKSMTVPGYWEDNGLPDYDGSVWFRRSFDAQADYKQVGAHVTLGLVDDYNIAWVNGHKIGEAYGNHLFTSYTVPDSIMKQSGNVLVVRVFDAGGKGCDMAGVCGYR